MVNDIGEGQSRLLPSHTQPQPQPLNLYLTLPRRASHERRIALYRFAPATMSYGRGYLDIPTGTLAELSELERAVVEPPYAVRLERPLVTTDSVAPAEGVEGGTSGRALKRPRSDAKKEHDRATIGTGYF